MGEELDVVCPFDADDGDGCWGGEKGGEMEFEGGRMKGEVRESLMVKIGVD